MSLLYKHPTACKPLPGVLSALAVFELHLLWCSVLCPTDLLYTTQPPGSFGTFQASSHSLVHLCCLLSLVLCSTLYASLADAIVSITCCVTILYTTTMQITAVSDISPCVQETEQGAPAVLLPMLTLEEGLMKCASNAVWWRPGMLAYAAPFPGMHFPKVLDVTTGQCIILADSCWLLPGKPFFRLAFFPAVLVHSVVISVLFECLLPRSPSLPPTPPPSLPIFRV